jgi:hypothetical protein
VVELGCDPNNRPFTHRPMTVDELLVFGVELDEEDLRGLER